MPDNNPKKLLEKYRSGKINEEEKAWLETWYLSYKEDDQIEISENEYLEVEREMWRHLRKNHLSLKIRPLWFRFAAAASIIVILSAGWLLLRQLNNSGYYLTAIRHDIPPGTNGAILTLANGQKISLEKTNVGNIVEQNGTNLRKANDSALVYRASDHSNELPVAYNTLETPKGKQYAVILADGSKVWLNSASSLKYPTAFNGTERLVELTGEAYFEVVHNSKMPFRVKTKNQMVEDIGTHFNINAYDDERLIKTTLLEGSVRLSIEGHSALLTPGDQAQIPDRFTPNKNTGINIIENADTDGAVAWKNGIFQFENADIQTIMRQFSRWYNVEIVYQGKIKERLFSGEIHRSLTLLQALDLLNYASVHINVDGKKIILTP